MVSHLRIPCLEAYRRNRETTTLLRFLASHMTHLSYLLFRLLVLTSRKPQQRAGFRQRLDALPGYGCDGLTQRRMGARLSITILLTSVVSVLIHPLEKYNITILLWFP